MSTFDSVMEDGMSCDNSIDWARDWLSARVALWVQ